MENEIAHNKRLERFLLIVGLYMTFDMIFWSVFPHFISTLPGTLVLYRVFSFIFGTITCAIPIVAGILVRNQNWKIFLIVAGAVTFLVRTAFFMFDLFKSFI